MKIKQKEQTVIMSALIFGLIFIAYRFIFSPALFSFAELYKKENQFKEGIKRNIDIIKNRQTITENYNLLFEKYRLEGDEESELLRTEQELDRISRSSQLKISKIQSFEPKEMRDYKQFTFLIDCNGDLNQVGNFVYNLSRSSMLFDVNRIRIQPLGTSPSMLRATITISRTGFPDIK